MILAPLGLVVVNLIIADVNLGASVYLQLFRGTPCQDNILRDGV